MQGTVIRATMRPQDLIPCFLTELRSYDVKAAEKIAADVPHAQIMTDAVTLDDDHPWWHSEEASEILIELFDALNEHAPEGMYFGAHPGDGSDYGWWGIDE